jgi:hypothetical protein
MRDLFWTNYKNYEKITEDVTQYFQKFLALFNNRILHLLLIFCIAFVLL